MDLSLTHFLGIDPGSARGSITCALLDGSRRILFRGALPVDGWQHECLTSLVTIAALTTPVALNTGLMQDDEKRKSLDPAPPRNRYTNLRVCEYELITRGFTSTRTPSALEDCTSSTQRHLRFSSEMGGCGFLRWSSPGSERQLMEVHVDSAFTELLGIRPFAASSLEGRIQRQLALQEERVNVPDAMEFFEEVTRHKLLSGKLPEANVLPASELNALAAAFTAWSAYTNPTTVTRLGDPTEGLIILPLSTRPR